MIAIDTNIIVRFLTADDLVQFKKTRGLFARENIFIPSTVILETEWVLRYAYKFGSADILVALRSLFGLPNVEVEAVDPISWTEKQVS